MQALYDGDERATISVHFDHGKVPDIKIVNRTENIENGCVKEITFGNVTIEIFERDKNAT